MTDLIFVQFLLESERGAIEQLRDAAGRHRIAAGSRTARTTLLGSAIPHHFEPFEARDWPTVNEQLYRCLMSPAAGTDAFDDRDTWSHFLVSQVAHLYPFARSIIRSHGRFPSTRIRIRHALSPEDYETLAKALSTLPELAQVDITDWDRCRVR